MARHLCALLVLLASACLSARGQDIYARFNGSCQQGGSPVPVNGINSAQPVQISYPFCTVTVFTHGTITQASIFSDAAGTMPIIQPLIATSTGSFGFYAANGRYDVTLSGAGIVSPFTISDITLCFNCSAGGGGGLSGQTPGQIPKSNTATTANSSIPIQGTDTSVLSSGTVSGVAASLCTDASGGATTVGCPTGGTPATPTGTIQGNNASSFGAVPGTSVNFSTGQVAITPPCAGGAALCGQWFIQSLENGNYAESFNWTQSPTSPTTISAGSTTVTINAVRGVNCWSSSPGSGQCVGFFSTHWLWLAGTGTAERVQITATTCTGASTGTCTVTFTAANSHSAGYTLGSATGGYQEAWNDLILLDRNTQQGTVQPSLAVFGRPGDFVTFNAPLVLDNFQGTVGTPVLDGRGATINCNTSGVDCILIGTGQGSNHLYLEPIGVLIQNFQFIPLTGFVRTANGTSIVIHDKGQKTHIQHTSYGHNSTYVFDDLVVAEDDQAFEFNDNIMNVGNGPPLKCDTTYCGVALRGSNVNSGALGSIHDNDFTMQCTGNPIDWESGNGMSIANNVFQNWPVWPWKYGAGLVDATIGPRNYYEGVCTNPYLGVTTQTGPQYYGNHVYQVPTTEPGALPSFTQFSNTGTSQYVYYITGLNGSSQQSNPLELGFAATNGVTNYTINWPPFNATSYLVLRVGPLALDGTDAAPYGTANWQIGTVASGSCSAVKCSFTETFGATTSVTINPAYVPANTDLTYWPAPLLLSNSGNSACNLFVGAQTSPIVNTGLFQTGCFYNAVFTGAGTGGGNNLAINGVNTLTGTRALIMTASQSSSSSGQAGTGARIFPPAQVNQVLTGRKGIFNMVTSWSLSSHDSDLFTFYDDAYAKTISTAGHQPANDTGDSAIGITTSPKYLGIRANTELDFYINHKFDSGTSAKEKLTASGHTFNVPITVTGGAGTITPASTTVAALPSAATNSGAIMVVSDSTPIATEGQTCVGSSGNVALAFSNGTTWSCFSQKAGGTAAGLAGTGACATITTQTGGAFSGQATCTGTTGASTLTITPGTTATNGWVCYVQDQTTRANLFQQTANNGTTCTMTITSVTQNDVFVFTATPF